MARRLTVGELASGRMENTATVAPASDVTEGTTVPDSTTVPDGAGALGGIGLLAGVRKEDW